MPADGPGCCVGTVVVSDAVQGSGSSELCNKRDIGSDVGCLSVGCRSFPSAEVSLGVLAAKSQRKGVCDDLCECELCSVCDAVEDGRVSRGGLKCGALRGKPTECETRVID